MSDSKLPQSGPVKVLNPYGEPETLEASDLSRALSMGYKIPTPDQVQAYQDRQEYGTGLGNEAQAFAEGAGSGATFGLSRHLENLTGITTPEAQAARAKYNPVASTTGELAGIGGALLAPELEGAGAVLNPVQAVAKAGRAVTEAAAPAAKAATSLLVNPETSPVVSRVLSGAASHAMGSAVEGAAYGLGQSVSEKALGDPDLNAEKVLSNVGYSALFAGALGGMFGGALEGMSKKVPNPVAEMNAPAIEAGDLGATVQASGFSAPEKEEFQKGLAELRPDAKEIQEAGDFLGAPVSPAQLSANKFVRNTYDSLLNGAPTMSGMRQANLAKQGWDLATGAVDSALGEGAGLSKAEIGNRFKDSITSKIQSEYQPIQEMYDALGASTSAIPVSESSTKRIARNIMELANEHNLVKGTPEHQMLQNFSEALPQIDNLERLKNFRTTLSRNTTRENAFVSGLIKEKLDNLEENVIKRFARDEMKTPEAKARITGLLDQMDQAKSGYKALRGKLEELGSQLGKKSIYGTKDFLDFFDNLTPEKVTDRLFAKNNSEFMGWFSKHFPEEMDLMRQYRLGEMKLQAMKTGSFNPKALFSQVDKLSPEMKAHLFTPDQLSTLQKAKVYLQSFPEKFNPSNTSNAEALRHFFNGPTGAILSNTRDFAMEKFIQNAVRFDPESGQNISHLVKIERMAQKTGKAITESAKSIFKAGGAIAIPAAAISASASKSSEKSHSEISEKVTRLNSDPEHLIDTLDQHTRGLYSVAPQTAGSVQATAIRATQFLSTKLPEMPAQKPFGRKLLPSQSEISKFNRYYQTVENPIQVLDQVRKGALMPESMEALQTVYPKLYAEMKTEVMDHLTDFLTKKNRKELAYGTKLSLSLFLNEDLDASTEQQAIAANQMAMNPSSAQQGAAPGVHPTVGGLKNLSQSERTLTAMQSSSQRGTKA